MTAKSFVLLTFFVSSFVLRGDILYDNTPGPLPPSVPGQAYSAADISQFGELISLHTSAAQLTSATIVLSTWAPQSVFPTFGNASGYNESLTFNIYAVDNSGATPEPGALLDSVSLVDLIPWRPESDPTCGAGANPAGLWRAGDGNCYNGMAFSETFSLANVATGGMLIWGLTFNTSTAGNPLQGSAGPYDQLNIGFGGAPSVGGVPLPTTAYLNSTSAAFYADGGAGGTGTFRQDQNWGGSIAILQLQGTSTPEPGSWMVGVGLAALIVLGWFRPRRRIAASYEQGHTGS